MSVRLSGYHRLTVTIYPTHVLDISLTLYLLPGLLTSDTIQMKAEILNVDLMSVNYVISQPKNHLGCGAKGDVKIFLPYALHEAVLQ